MDLNERRAFGRTEFMVGPLGFGGNALGNLYDVVEEDAALDTVAAAYELGVRFFDTAPLYGHGASEHRMGFALRRYRRDSFILSTKVGRLLRPHGKVPPPRLAPSQGGIFAEELPFEPVFDYTHDGVKRSIEDSLQRLGMNRIDIALIHDADAWTHGDKLGDRLDDVRVGAMPVLRKLKAEGTIAAIGAGVNQWEACERLLEIGDFDCFLLAGRYTLLEQGALESFLPLCEERNVPIILGAPFNSGILATGAIKEARYNYLPAPDDVKAKVAAIERVCAAHGVPLPAAALQFPLAHPAVSIVIPGGRTRAEVVRNAELMAAPIPEALWTDLKAEKLIAPHAPTPAGT